MKLLFVCSRNRLRSLTAETVFDGVAGHQVRSAGTAEGARIRVTAGHVGWAEMVFVMEKKHAAALRERFRQEMEGKPLVCLHIPDEYGYLDEELVDRLHAGVAPHVDLGDDSPTEERPD